MPTYDYRCDRCEASFEFWQSMKDDALTTCPAEGGPEACQAPGEGPVRKVFSSVGISFKGDGFYKNDHGANASGRRRDDAKSTSDSSSSSSDSTSSSGSTASDASSSSSSSSSSTTSTSTSDSSPNTSSSDS